MEFEWDSRKAAANLVKHKVSFEEAATAFGDPFGWIVADPRHSSGEERFVLLGISRGRRLIAVMYTDRGHTIRIISARRATNDEPMKKQSSKNRPGKLVNGDEILPEYDFRNASRNKYAARYAAGSAVVVLEPDVAAVFPTSGDANEALRALAGIIRQQRNRRPA